MHHRRVGGSCTTACFNCIIFGSNDTFFFLYYRDHLFFVVYVNNPQKLKYPVIFIYFFWLCDSGCAAAIHREGAVFPRLQTRLPLNYNCRTKTHFIVSALSRGPTC